MTLIPRFRHLKTGGVYRVLATSRLQISPGTLFLLGVNTDDRCILLAKSLDMQEVTTYVSEQDNSMWVRLTSEFNDGRFEAI